MAQVLNKDMTRPFKEQPDNFRWNFFFFEFEVVEPVEPEQQTGRKFKVGDRVRRTEESGLWHEGDTGTIVVVDNSGIPYKVKIDRSGRECWSCEKYLEKIEEPEYFSGKAVCVKSNSDFTVGKVYEFVNGQTTDNGGDKRPNGYRLKTPEEYGEHTDLYEFIPFVE